MQTEQKPLILTLRLDTSSQAFFDHLRTQHFPVERNFLKAHLTLFHQLPNDASTRQYLNNVKFPGFKMMVNGLRHLGAGVAYQVHSAELQQLHGMLSRHFQDDLIAQDRQPFKPHVTIQNKVTPEVSRQLLGHLKTAFEPFPVQAIGMDVWLYLNGPWRHETTYLFS